MVGDGIMTRRLLGLLVLGALAACGKEGSLEPAPGMTAPPKPATALVAPTTEDLLTPSSQAAPRRVDELLRRSEERRDDRFDLPPPG